MPDDVRYPIGRFDWKKEVSPADREGNIAAIEAEPEGFRKGSQG